MELALFDLFNELPYTIAFVAGVLTFLSPCVLPLILPYMSYISGISIEELKDRSLGRRFFIFRKTILFVSGFSLIFIAFGISFNTFLGALLANKIIKYIAGGIIILFGIHFLGIVKFRALYKSKTLNLPHQWDKDGKFGAILRFISPFILGVGFALGWTPCVGPILSSIMILSSTNFGGALGLMIIYALGLSLPFLLTALAVERCVNIFGALKNRARIIEIISGILLLGIGIAIICGGLDRIANF